MLSLKSLPTTKLGAYGTYFLAHSEPGYIMQTAAAEETGPVGCRNINTSLIKNDKEECE
jgi:hypothetical protein